VIILASDFLLVIRIILITDGFRHQATKGYIYVAIAFAAFVEASRLLCRCRAIKHHLYE
jgi:predicted tellurium resistance membrane protein TerC